MAGHFKTLAALLGCVLATGSLRAQDGVGFPFIRIDRDPVSAGMGFAGAASTEETAYSSFRNSSVIPFSERKATVGVSGQSWAPDGVKSTNVNFGTAFKVSDRIGFSLGAAYQMGEEYAVFNTSGDSKGTYKPSDLVIGAGTGFRILNNLSFGADFRYARQSLSVDDSFSAFNADAFLTYHSSDLNVTAGVSSYGSSLKSASGESYSLPTSATVGAEWAKALSDNHGVRLAADADYFFSGAVTAAAGAQYSFKNMFFLRGGYHFGTNDAVLPSFATVGLGVRFFGVSLDLAYLTANDILGNTLTVGLGCRF